MFHSSGQGGPVPMRQERVVPDGGWGWVIVGCSFLIHMFVVGSLYALSVIYVSWLEAFHSSKGYTSWIISLAVAVMFGIGPLPGFISRRFSNRVAVIAGGILMFLGFFCSVFATSVLHLICSVGITVGIGAGCCYLPSVSMVAMYFNKKRSIAMGLSSAGLGAGAFLMPLYLNWMVENYGWRGCMLILSALSLNMCVLGFLMRPLEPEQRFTIATDEEDVYASDVLYVEKVTSLSPKCDNYEESSSSWDEDDVHFCDECNSSKFYYSQLDESSKFIGCKHHALPVIEISLLNNDNLQDREMPCFNDSQRLHLNSEEIDTDTDCDNNTYINPPTEASKEKRFGTSALRLGEIAQQRLNDRSNIGGSLQCIEKGSLGVRPSSNIAAASCASLRSANTKVAHNINMSAASSLSNAQIMMSGNLYNAVHSCRAVHSLMSLQSDKTASHYSTDKPINDRCKDNNRNCVSPIRSTTHEECGGDDNYNTHIKIIQKSKMSRIRQKLASSLRVYLSLIKNGTFMVFCISNFLTNLSFFMPVLYMVDRAIDEGITKNGAAMLVSLYGVGNIFGKLFFGWLADRGIVDRLVIYIGCLGMAGFATCLSPLCGDERALHGVYSFSFGCFIGSYCTLYPIVTVDLVGLEFVDESVGVILCFMGVATAFGSPLAGWIFDWTGSYTMAYALHGVFILISAAMMLPTFVLLRCRNNKGDNYKEKKDLEF